MKIIFLGAPGAGKGTHAARAAEALIVPTVSTGEILRAAIRDETPVGVKAKSFIDAGSLVPDEIVIGLVRERLAAEDCKNGFILDGFPRTVAQAKALEALGVKIDRVVNIHVPDEVIVCRMSGRRVCSGCGKTYHTVYNRPKVDGVCDDCGKELIVRGDDMPETVRHRLEVYETQTAPLKEYYEKKGILATVEGQEQPDDTSKLVFASLGIK
ncbi:MAG: adenylate kinase [Clostridia bacterium]|nr:adenylate kinase [Clostridia bacterium]